MNRYIILVLVLFSFRLSFSTEQQRGLWVVRYALSDKAEINSIISTATRLRITDLYIQVRAMGEEYHPALKTSGADTLTHLDLLLRKAAQLNIRVHAWINMMYIWAGKNDPENPDHLLFRAEKSILRSALDHNIPEYEAIRREGIEGFYLHPTDPDHINDIYKFITTLLNRYAFNGIHLDYFRMPGLKYSFSPFGRTRFMIKHFLDPVHIYGEPESFIQERGRASFFAGDHLYKTFLHDEFFKTLDDINNHIKDISEKYIFSVAVKPDPIHAKHNYFQDWQRWLENGLCDQVLIMNYAPEYSEFMKNIKMSHQTGLGKRIIVGISTYNQKVSEAKRRIFLVNNLDFAGIALFSYNHLAENRPYLNSLSFVKNTGGKYVENRSRTKGN